MGIPGIFKHIGPGDRVALSKLAVEHLEQAGRPFRIAIDISIWHFQILSGQGGKNPALRTLYYRLLRLLALSIQPLFVFDGPHKPPFKRGKKIAPGAACLPDFLTKELLKRFGFPYHIAPGEAEAECALLQREGIVDAVMSEDVDTLMFGCGLCLRSWTAEGVRGNKTPTHVNAYRADSTKEKSRLDGEGMTLVALMSGGDYIPAGIEKCGPKTAIEAAKAGFGRDLCLLSKRDTEGLRKWRERLQHELWTNSSKYFRQKHKTLVIPENFPDMTVLGYYKHPAISAPDKVSRLRNEIDWNQAVDVPALRLFVADAFNWTYRGGAKQFIRGLAPVLLAHNLVQRSKVECDDEESIEAKQASEGCVVKSILGRRSRWNTGGMPELRVAYIPNDIVGIDLNAEEEDDYQDQYNHFPEDEGPASDDEDAGSRSRSPTKRRGPSAYDPTKVEKIWVVETFVKLGVPLLVETWEEDMRDPKKFTSRKAREKKALDKAKTKASTEAGTMHQYVKVTKAGVVRPPKSLAEKENDVDINLPPVILAPATAAPIRSPQRRATVKQSADQTKPKTVRVSSRSKQAIETQSARAPRDGDVPMSPAKKSSQNPWTLSKRPSDTFGFKSPSRYSALGIYPPSESSSPTTTPKRNRTAKEIHTTLASPPLSPFLTPSKKRRSRPVTPSSDTEVAVVDLTEPPNALTETPPAKSTGLQTPSTRDSCKPSPAKRRSPLTLAHDLQPSAHPKTPTSLLRKTRLDDHNLDHAPTDGIVSEQLTAKKVNRVLDFSTTLSQPGIDIPEAHAMDTASPVSSPSSLPSPSVLTSPPSRIPQTQAREEEASSLLSRISKPNQPDALEVRQLKRYVALRTSLEGAWKHLESGEVDERFRGRRDLKGVFGDVEVLDLSGR